MLATSILFLCASTSLAELAQLGGRRVAWLHGSATVGPHIQTGIVPIFDKRNTMEPITFTFTTPQPRPAAVAAAAAPSPWPAVGAAPALRPTDAYEAPYARPAAPLRMSAYKPSFQASFVQPPETPFNHNYQIPSVISARSAFLPSSPTHHFPPYQSFPSSPSFSPPHSFSSPLSSDQFGREIEGVRHNAIQSWTQTTVTPLPSTHDDTSTVTMTTPRIFRITLPYPKPRKGKKVVTTTPSSLLDVMRQSRTITIRLPSPDEEFLTGNGTTTVDEDPISIDTELVKKSLWESVEFLKSAVADAGVDRDWRALWTKMSGVVEPYVAKMTQHLGSAINVALREQNKRKMRTTPSPYWVYSSSQNRVKRV